MPDQDVLGNLSSSCPSLPMRTKCRVTARAGNREVQCCCTHQANRTWRGGTWLKPGQQGKQAPKHRRRIQFESVWNISNSERWSACTHKACVSANKIPTHTQWSCCLWCRSTSKKRLKCLVFILQSAECDTLYLTERLPLDIQDSHMLCERSLRTRSQGWHPISITKLWSLDPLTTDRLLKAQHSQ